MAEQGMANLEALYLKKINRRIGELARYVDVDEVRIDDVRMAETPDHLTLSRAKKLKYCKAVAGRGWGKPWSSAWFRFKIVVPESFAGETVTLIWDTKAQCLIFRNGIPVQALDDQRNSHLLYKRAKAGATEEIFVEAGTTKQFGGFDPLTVTLPRIAVTLRPMWDAVQDLQCLARLVEQLPRDDTRRSRLLRGLNKAVDAVDYQDLSRESLRKSARRIRSILAPLFDRPAHASAQTIACLGHSHIDVAWLWPLRETVRKCGRTFANVLELMDRYPTFTFCQSQPHLYEFTRDNYPEIYAQIRKRVAQGRWFPTGCMWVEADCNVTSGESLVRQVLFGTRFFREEFGYRVECLWIPDVFGYSAALPQILKRSGVDNFLTQKISWSQFTKFPHHSFWWEGIDGSRVLTHFPPADTYNGTVDARELHHAEANYRQKDCSEIQALPVGAGDGGGGPTAEILERIARYEDLEGVPHTVQMSAPEFFRRLSEESAAFPVWIGELYLELHRATLTTQANNKKLNRRGELALRDAEFLSVLATRGDECYPQEKLNQAWKTLLLNQFHDIIPGSSITEVYEDSDRDYTEILATASAARADALRSCVRQIDTRGKGKAVLVYNSLSWDRSDIVTIDAEKLPEGDTLVAVAPGGATTLVQRGLDGKARFCAHVPSMGYAVYHIATADAGLMDSQTELNASVRKLENESLCVRLDAQGRVVSVYDKLNNREVTEEGTACNQILLFEDKPCQWDAWDVDIFYNDKLLHRDGELISVKVVEEGPVRVVVRVERKLSKSTITQDLVLYTGIPRLDFETRVDWGDEKDVLLKTAFPVAVRSDKARFEIQFGNVERPTHWNTPGDFARFEVAGHKWVDLSEGDYGVALLNDSKYGHDVRDNVIRTSLLRAPKHPDPVADVNKQHSFTYSLYPHAGNYTNGVVRAGYELNVPLLAKTTASRKGEQPASASHMQITGDNVIIDTVKKAEDDDATIIRLYEAHGCRGTRTLSTDIPFSKIFETNLMEHEERKLKAHGDRLELEFKPFQIITLKLKP